MMEENQFHYTLITTYSSGRRPCTDPGLDSSVPVCVHVGGGGGTHQGLSLSLHLNYINASVASTPSPWPRPLYANEQGSQTGSLRPFVAARFLLASELAAD